MIDHLAERAWDSLLALQGEPVEVFPVKGAAHTRDAIFEETSIQVDAASGMLVRTSNPSIGVFYKEGEQPIIGGDRIKRKGHCQPFGRFYHSPQEWKD